MSASPSTPSLASPPPFRNLISDAEQRAAETQPSALQAATKEYHAAEADWQRAMQRRHTGQVGARAYRAACDALVVARAAYAVAFRAEHAWDQP